MNELVYREIDPHNAQELSDFILCHEYSFRDSSENYIPITDEQLLAKTKRLKHFFINEGHKFYCLAVFADGKMVAAHFLDRYIIEKIPSCHIHGLWVHESYRRRGIARKLKLMGEEWALKKGCKMMDTNVNIDNAQMISLNKSLGYEIKRFNFRKMIG